MKDIVLTMVGFCVATSAFAQSPHHPPSTTAPAEPPDDAVRDPKAIEILERASEAIAEVKVVTYTAEFTGEGFYLKRIGIPEGSRISGSFTAAPIEDSADHKLRFDVNHTPKGADKPDEFSFGTDGDVYFFIDPKTKTVYEDVDPIVCGPRAEIGLRTLAMREYLAPEPFNDEINAQHVELGEERTIAGETCREVRIQYARSNQRAHWYFGKEDHLPRGVRRVFTNDDGERSMVELTITHLAVNPTFFVDPFTPIVPEEWTRNTDDVAP